MKRIKLNVVALAILMGVASAFTVKSAPPPPPGNGYHPSYDGVNYSNDNALPPDGNRCPTPGSKICEALFSGGVPQVIYYNGPYKKP